MKRKRHKTQKQLFFGDLRAVKTPEQIKTEYRTIAQDKVKEAKIMAEKKESHHIVKMDLETRATDVELLRDRRIAPGACCKNCKFAYPYKVDLVNSVLECRQGPAQYPIAIGMDGAGNIVQSKVGGLVPRIVPDNYFCGCWAGDLQ